MANVMRQFLDNSYLYGANATFIEDLYEKYLVNPQSVAEEWREYFDRIQVLPGSAAKDVAHAPVVESFVQRAKAGQLGGPARTLPVEPVTPERPQVAALLLVTAYRIAGSRWATVDPLKRMPRPSIPELEPGFYDLSEADLDQTVNAGSFVGLDRTSLRNLLQALRDTYCRNIGFEYMFISERAQRQWIQERIEPVRATPNFPPEQKKRLLQKVTEAEQLERYLHTRYVGQKRFSLEGGESLIPSIDELIQRAGQRAGQDAEGPVPRVRGQARFRAAVRGREIPQRVLLGHLDGGRPGAHLSRVQSVSPGDRGPGGGGLGAGAPAPAQRQDRRPGDAHSLARRRRIRGAGRRDGDAEPVRHARLRHRRHGASHRQQPDRLHHFRSARHALDHLLHRRGENGRGTDLPRQRRRSGGGAVRHAAGARFPPEVPQGRGDRHRLLPQARPQRAGRAVHHAAADVQEDHAASGHAQALRRQAARAGRDRARGARGADQAVPRHARCRAADGEPGAVQLQEQVRGRLGAVPQLEVDRCCRHAGSASGTSKIGRKTCGRTGGLQSTPDGAARDRKPQADGGGQAAGRLGHGRDARLRVAARKRLRREALRAGLGTRHLRASTRGSARPGARALGRGQLHSAAEHLQGPGRLRGHRLGVIGRSGTRVRIRVLDRRTERAGGLGSAVRRLCQRRPGGDGPVHQLGGDQVGPRVRPDPIPAARL